MAAVVAATGCGQKKTAVQISGLEMMDGALAPSAVAAAMRKAGGAHFHGSAMFRVDPQRLSDPGDGTKPASPSTVTTTTDLWMDKQGNFRLVESNDQDGGREIVRVGGEVAVALRYGKMIRRAAQDSENARFVAEALGAPWAAWEIVRRQVEVEQPNQGVFRFKLGNRLASLPAGFPAAEGLRKWRDTVEVTRLEGEATLARDGQVPLAFACKAAFRAVRDQPAKVSIVGEIVISAALDEVGKVADIALPEAETLRMRQRTVLDERALLGGLGTGLSPAAKRAVP